MFGIKICMQHLKEVHVKECKGLSSVFPASVAKDLMKLGDRRSSSGRL